VFDNPKFAKLVADGRATGEVVGVDRFLVTVQGLGNVAVNALIYFDNGHQGLVREVRSETVMILNMSAETIGIGTLAVIEAEELVTGVGEAVLGRVLSVTGQPLDGKGPITFSRYDPVFKGGARHYRAQAAHRSASYRRRHRRSALSASEGSAYCRARRQ